KKAALASAQVKLAPRLIHKQGPAIRADEKWHRNRRAVRCQKRCDLAVDHAIEMATPVELIRALTQAKHRSIRVKPNGVCAVALAENQFLNELPIRAAHGNSEWLRLERDPELAGADGFLSSELANAEFFIRGKRNEHRGRRAESRPALLIQRRECDAQCALADFADDQLCRTTGEANRAARFRCGRAQAGRDQ